MKKSYIRFFLRSYAAIVITTILLNLSGAGNYVVHALNTTIDDIPGAAITIPDPAAGASCTAAITRTINVPSLQIADINIGLNITHARRSDVRVTLTSPAGTTVALIGGQGLGSPVIASPDDFANYDVLLDDTSINSLYDNDNDAVGAPFYDRTARPNEPLSSFKGENAAGNWTLTICDNRNGITGAYNRAQLIFASADPNTISGTVFTDYNDNGIRSQGDIPVAGILATAYNSANSVIASGTTNTNGQYSLNIADGTPVRIEFSNIPSTLRSGAFGPDSGTTVQFVTSPAAGVDLGLSKPDEYCQSNPFLILPCYINGDPLGGGSASSADVLVSLPYTAYGRQDNTLEKPLASGIQIGATWGLAIQRSTGFVFAGALAKRHMGLGPMGAGGIYTIQIDPATGAAISVSNFVDLATLGIPVGTLGSNAARGLPNVAATPNSDPTAWDAAGKAAIGDMEMGSNDDTLWLVNLANQTLYSIVVGNPPTTPTNANVSAYPISLPAGAAACAAGDIRPWAVSIYRGLVYIGVVCSAESTQNVNDLEAYVLSTSETTPGTFSLVFQMPLNYPRGQVSSDTPTGFPAEWRPWSPTMTSLCADPCTGTGSLSFGKQLVYPQPILSDIEFDTNGDIVLGLMDRAGHQTGNANYATSNPWGTVTLYNKDTNYTPTTVTINSNTQTYEGTSAGDTIRVCKVGGVFAAENNATCGGITTNGNNSNPGQGPGNGEYYWQDMYSISTNKNGGTHNEITLGGMALFAGTGEIAVSIFDPFEVRTGGISWFNNLTGTRTRAYEIFGLDQGGGSTTFGKAAGLGDIEGFCFNAPIEIGNRIWLDENSDGIQTPGEAAIAGVTVELYQNGVLIATAVTDVDGNYFFSSGPGTSSSSHIYALDGLNPNETYEIRLPNSQGASQQAALTGLALTANDTDADQRDSDGTLNGNNATITLTTGNPGDNNHTYDFGFTTQYSLGNRVWLDNGAGGGGVNNGLQDGTEVGVDGVVVNLFADANSDGVPDGPSLATTTTAAGGFYLFNNLMAGNYLVEVAASNFTGTGPLVGLISSSVDEASPNADIDLTDNGIGTYPDATTGIRSGTVTLGLGSLEPTGENNPTTNPLPGEASDDHSNRTVDFGFVLSQMNKSLIGSDLVSTTNPEVTVGEIVTYQVIWNIPPGTYTNLILVDTMERGLAFVGCDSISGPNLTTSIVGGFPSICATPTTDNAGGGTPADIDRRVTFSFGTLINGNQTDIPITVTYRAIVLDIADNINDNELNNSALWTWDTGSLGPSPTTVRVIEPELNIEKTSNINFIAAGSEVTFSLTVTHTPNSRMDASDVFVQDILPAGLDYVDNSLDCNNGEQDPINCTYDVNTRTITAQWATFTLLPAGDRGIINFRVIGNSSIPPSGKVTNVGTVTWTSIPGDHTVPRSYSNPANSFATERHYNPNDSINKYGDNDSLTLTPLGGGGNGTPTPAISGFLIPVTGFTPNTITKLNTTSRPVYDPSDLTIEIPAIQVDASIVGVKLQRGNWDVSWLQNQVGWLNGTAYPTWTGNSVLTAHSIDTNGRPSIFYNLKGLNAGDFVYVYNSGYRYIYKVVSNRSVQPNDITVLEHEQKAYLTLITCDHYDIKSSTFRSRIVIQAVLVDVSVTK